MKGVAQLADTVVVFSGGADSTAAVLWAQRQGYEVKLLTFQTGHPTNARELPVAERLAAKMGLPLTVMPLHELLQTFRDASGVTRMPFGAGILLSLACSWALREGIHRVVFGYIAEDAEMAGVQYTQAFSSSVAARVAEGAEMELSVILPFAEQRKSEVLTLFQEQPDLFALTLTCTAPTEESGHCGTCPACASRRAAAAQVGLEDRTVYGASPVPLS